MIESQFTFQHFKNCLETAEQEYATFPRITMRDFQVRTEITKRISLSCADVKRWWACPTHSYPLSSSLIRKYPGVCYYCLRNQRREAEVEARARADFKQQQKRKRAPTAAAVPQHADLAESSEEKGGEREEGCEAREAHEAHGVGGSHGVRGDGEEGRTGEGVQDEDQQQTEEHRGKKQKMGEEKNF